MSGGPSGRRVQVRTSGRGSRSPKNRAEQLSDALMAKDMELRALQNEHATLSSNYAIVDKDNRENTAELKYLRRAYEKIAKDFRQYRKSVEERESTIERGLLNRFFGWPLRFSQSILSRETRKREEKLKLRGMDIARKNSRIADLKIKVSKQKQDLSSRTIGEKEWRQRYESLARERRSEKGLETDSLVSSLRDRLRSLREENTTLTVELSELRRIHEEADEKLDSVYAAVQKANNEFEILEVMDSCWKSAKKSPYQNPNMVYKTIGIMANEALEWMDTEEGSGSFEDEIRMYLDVAEQDSKDRYWKVGSINEKMNRHIKLGVNHDPSKTLRIYYDISRRGKLRLAWCGEHP